MGPRIADPVTPSARATHCSIGALRAALFAALGVHMMGGCGSASDAGGSESGSTSQPLVCQEPASFSPLPGHDADGGYEVCAGGWYHRSEAEECPSALPRDMVFTGQQGTVCEDASCAADPHGHCTIAEGPGPTTAFCAPGCVSDDECSPGQICFCENPVGRCVTAYCATDADCPGSLCVGTPNREVCSGRNVVAYFACADTRDACRAGAACEPAEECRAPARPEDELDRARTCAPALVCGRPFLVSGIPRQATVSSRSDWSAARSPDVRALDASTRDVLAAHWTELGLMEHASVAAFARFVLELMAAGAPCELLALAQRALGDEVEHAQLCFGLASAYAGEPIGPGALSTQGVLDELDLQSSVVRVIHEACVGETLAAVEALEALTTASDPAVVEVLERVVRDETAHAELGWKVLKWALAGAGPALRERARSELDRAIDAVLAASLPEIEPAEPGSRPQLEQHGLCPSARRNGARREALLHVVRPLARELLSERGERGGRARRDGASTRS